MIRFLQILFVTTISLTNVFADQNFRFECTGPLKSLSWRERNSLNASVDVRFVNEAANQLSGTRSEPQDYETYVGAFVGWLKEISEYPKASKNYAAFKAAQIARLEIYYSALSNEGTKYPTEPMGIAAVYSLNKTGVNPPQFEPAPQSFNSKKSLEREIDKFQRDLETVRDQREVDLNIRQAVLIWKIEKVMDLLSLSEKEEARASLAKRKGEAQAAGKTLDLKDLLEVEGGMKALQMIEAALFILEWKAPELAEGKTESPEENAQRLRNPYQPLPWASSFVSITLNSFIKKFDGAARGAYVQTSAKINKYFALLVTAKTVMGKWKTPIEVFGLASFFYITVVNGGGVAITRTGEWVKDLKTPTDALVWRDNAAAMQQLKLDIADPSSLYDQFSVNYGTWAQLKSSDHAGRVAHEYLTYWMTTGKTDWKPANPDDAKFIPGAMDLIQKYNVLMFGTDNRGNRYFTPARDRLTMREQNLLHWEEVGKAVKDGKIIAVMPLPDGVTPPGPEKPDGKNLPGWSVVWGKFKNGSTDAATHSWSWIQKQFQSTPEKAK